MSRSVNTQFDRTAPKLRLHLDKTGAWKSEDWPELLVVRNHLYIVSFLYKDTILTLLFSFDSIIHWKLLGS